MNKTNSDKYTLTTKTYPPSTMIKLSRSDLTLQLIAFKKSVLEGSLLWAELLSVFTLWLPILSQVEFKPLLKGTLSAIAVQTTYYVLVLLLSLLTLYRLIIFLCRKLQHKNTDDPATKAQDIENNYCE